MKLNLLSATEQNSLFKTALERVSDPANILNKHELKQQLDSFIHRVTAFVSAWTTEDIAGLERAPGIALVNAEYAQFEAAVQNFRGLMRQHAALVYGEGDYQFAKQIQVVSERLITLGCEVAGVSGHPMFGEPICNPVLLSRYMLDIAAVFSVEFGQNKDPISSLMVEVLAKVSSLYQSILAEMTLRGIDLNVEELGEDGLNFITDFAQMNGNIEDIQETLEQLYLVVNSYGSIERLTKEHPLDHIDIQLEAIGKTVSDRQLHKIIKNFHALRRGASASSQFVTFIRDINKQARVAGVIAIPDALTISQWEISHITPYWADYHINELRMIASQYLPLDSLPVDSISNPLLWSYSTLGLIIFYGKKYSIDSNAHDKHISTADSETIQEAILEGQKIQALLHQLGNPKLYESLLEQIELSLVQFKTRYLEFLEAFEIKQGSEIDSSGEALQSKIDKLRIQFNLEVCQHFESDIDSPFGQAITHYFANLKMLRAFLALGMHDQYKRVGDSDIGCLFTVVRPLMSRKEMVGFLQSNKSSLGVEWFALMEQSLALHKKYLPNILNKMGPLNYCLFESVLAVALQFFDNCSPMASIVDPLLTFENESGAIELEAKFFATSDPYMDLQAQIGELSFKIVTNLTHFGDGNIENTQATSELLSRYAIATSIQPIKHLLRKILDQSEIFAASAIDRYRLYAAQSLRNDSLPMFSIGDPLLWSYSTLARLLLYRKQYSTLASKPENHISILALKQVQEALLEGLKFQAVSNKLSDPLVLLAQLESSFEWFKICYQASFTAFRMNHLNEAKERQKQAAMVRRVRDISALRAQTIHPSLVIFDEQNVVSAQPGYTHDPSHYEGYTFAVALKDIVEKQKKEYLRQCDFVIYPEPGFDGPILPLPPELVAKIHEALPKVMLDAIELNLSELNFRYFIEDGKTFHLAVYFGNTICWQTSLDYQPLVHTGAEAIWWYWVGGAQYKASAISSSNQVFLDYAEKNSTSLIVSEAVLASQNVVPKLECDKVKGIAEKLIESNNKEIGILYHLEVRQEFELKTGSPLGQAITHYFLNLQSVRGILALCLVDEKRGGDFNRLLQADKLPTSRKKMLEFLEKNSSLSSTSLELFEKMDVFLANCKTHLPNIIEQAKASYHAMVDNVLSHGSHFVDDYAPTANDCPVEALDVMTDVESTAQTQEGLQANSPLGPLAISMGVSNPQADAYVKPLLLEYVAEDFSDVAAVDSTYEFVAEPSEEENIGDDADLDAVKQQTILSVTNASPIDLKAQIAKLSLAIVSHFDAGTVKNIKRALVFLDLYVMANNIQLVKHTLQAVKQPLTEYRSNQRGEKTNELIDLMSESIKYILVPGTPDYNRDIRDELLTVIKKTNKCAAVAGAAEVPNHATLLRWDILGKSNWADFHINELRMLASTLLPPASLPMVSVGNPLLWSYAAAALILHYRKQLSASQDEPFHLTMTDIKAIQEVLLEGQHIQELLKQLRAPQLYNSLIIQLESSFARFKACHQEGLDAFSLQHLNEAKERHKQAEKYRSVQDANALKAQIIIPSLVIFDGKSVVSTQPGYTHDSSRYKGYTFAIARKEKIEEQKAAYLSRCGFVIYPEPGFEGPILPLTPEVLVKIHECLPKVILDAVALNLQKLNIRYSIADSNLLWLMVYFGDSVCCKIKINYQPRVYTGAEAIWCWWVGEGELCEVSAIGCSETVFLDYVRDNRVGKAVLPDLSSMKTLINHNRATKEEIENASSSAAKLIESLTYWIQTNYNTQVRQALTLDVNSSSAQALTEFFATLKSLKAFFALCWHDEYEKQDSELTGFLYADELPTSLDDVIADRLNIMTKMEALLAKYKYRVPKIFEQDKPAYYALLEDVLSQCTRFIDDYSPTVTLNPLEKVVQITNELVDAWTQEGIKGFEKEPAVVDLHTQLFMEKDDADRLSTSQSLKNNKANIYAKRVHLDKVAADPHYLIGRGATAVDFPIKNSELPRQIKVISEQLLNVGMQVAGLAGYGALAAPGAVTTFGLGSSLLGAAAAISDVFRSQSNPLVPMMASVLTELVNQHRELLAEMALRHIDLKAEIGEVGLAIVTQFSNLDAKVENIQETLGLLHQRIVEQGLLTKCVFNSITQSLAQVRNLLSDKTVTDVIDSISEPINRIAFSGSGGYIDAVTMGNLSSQLLTSIKETSKRAEVAGVGKVPDLLTMSQWKTSTQPALWANFHINELRMIASQNVPSADIPVVSIANPLLWAYSTLALLLLYRKQYSTSSSDGYANHISPAELKNVHETILEGQTIQRLFKGLRDPHVYESLFTSLESSLTKFEQCYEEKVRDINAKQIADIEQQRKSALRVRRERDVNNLEAQTIETCCIRFDGKSVTNSQLVRNDVDVHAIETTFLGVDKDLIQEQKNNFFRQPSFIVYPEPGFNGPILPLTPEVLEKIVDALPKVLLDAIEWNLGDLTFHYLIEDSKQFSLVVYFKDSAVLKISAEYKANLIYHLGAEAIWRYWAGGVTFTGFIVGTAVTSKMFHDYYEKNMRAFLPSIAATPTLAECNKVPANECKSVIQRAEKLLASKKEQLQIQCNLEIRHDFKSDTDSPFGQAMTEYFANFKCLKAYFALCLDDTGIEFYSRLQVSELPSSREEMVAYLAVNKSLTGLEVLANMKTYVAALQKHLSSMFKETALSNDGLIDSVLKDALSFIDVYAPTQVPFNYAVPFTESQVADVELERENAQTEILIRKLMALKEGVYSLNLTPEQKEQAWNIAKNKYETFLGDHPHIAAEGLARPARLMAARRDSPVFGQRVTDSSDPGALIDDNDAQHINEPNF